MEAEHCPHHQDSENILISDETGNNATIRYRNDAEEKVR